MRYCRAELHRARTDERSAHVCRVGLDWQHLGGPPHGRTEPRGEIVDGGVAVLDFVDDRGGGEGLGDYPSETVQRQEPPFSRLAARD